MRSSLCRKFLSFHVDVMMVFLDITLQDLHSHAVEWPLRLGVIGIVMGSFDRGGCSVFFSFDLVREFARFLCFCMVWGFCLVLLKWV